MPIFSSTPVQTTSLARPGSRPALTQILGTMKIEMPLVPAGAPSMRARTGWMMFSARSCSPLVIKILSPRIAVGAVRVWGGGCGQRPHVRSGLRFGQQHGAAPLAGVELFEKQRFLVVGPVKLDHLAGAVAHAGVVHQGVIAAVKVFRSGHVDGMRQALPAEPGVLGQGRPLPLDEQFVGTAETFGHRHPPLVEVDPDPVPLGIGRQKLLDGEIARLGQDHVEHFAVQPGVLLLFQGILGVHLFVKHEIDIAAIGNDLCHDCLTPPFGFISPPLPGIPESQGRVACRCCSGPLGPPGVRPR